MAAASDSAPLGVIVLAAGQGTRMRSDLPKVLHPIGGLAMVHHVLRLVAALGPARTAVVVGHGGERVAEAARQGPVADVDIVVQEPQLGTGHAVTCAKPVFEGFEGRLLVLYADTPLLTVETVARLVETIEGPTRVGVLGFRPADAAQYGRLKTDAEGGLEAIIEFAEAGAEERAIGLCNSGVMAGDARTLFRLLEDVGNDNAKGEYYLTDLVGLARNAGFAASVAEADEAEVMGVNSRLELAAAEKIFQARARDLAMASGVTLLDPDTVYFHHDTELGRDVVVGQNVVFGPGAKVDGGAEILPFSHIEGAHVAAGARIGPFARLRPGARVGADAHIGNFVEVKKADIAAGAKVNHLSYIGDATIGERTNIGAGTITCNYDGFLKHRTEIGADVFIGSDTLLVAPVKVGDGAITGSGTVVTQDLEADALGITRPDWRAVEGYAVRYRERKTKEKAARKG